MSSVVNQTARFDSFHSAANGGVGVFIRSKPAISIANLGFSVNDANGVLYQTGVTFQGRIAIVRGLFADSPDNLIGSPYYDLRAMGYEPIVDAVYSTLSGLISFGGGQDSGSSREGEGLSVIMGPATLTGGAGTPSIIVAVFGTSGPAAGASVAPPAALGAQAANGRGGGSWGYEPRRPL